MSQQQAEILEICENINEQLEIQQSSQQFSFRTLRSKGWYLKVLKIVFPYLADKFTKIEALAPDQTAIDSFLVLLTKQEIIQNDFLDIKGGNIVKGDYESIYYVVQLLNALIGRQLGDQDQQGQDGYQEEQQQRSASVRQKKTANNEASDLNMYLNQKSKKNSKHGNSSSQRSQKECHSVLGINHEFQQSQENSSPNRRPEYQYQQDSPFRENRESSNKNPININSHQQVIKNAPLTSSFPPGVQQPKTFKAQYSDQPEEDGSPYLHQKLQKHTSQPRIKNFTSAKKKKYDNVPATQKKNKRLINHPTIKKGQKRASNPESQKLTSVVRKVLKDTKSNLNDQKTIQRVKSANNFDNRPLQQQLRAKNRQLQYYAKDFTHNALRVQKSKKNQVIADKRHDQRLQKMLKWRQGLMIKQKKAFQKSIKTKVQMKRQQYVKKINQFILLMEKEKQRQQQRQFKENLMKENQDAAKRMIALEQWYQDRLNMMKDKKSKQRSERNLMHTGHRQIIKQIQRDLKKQNQQKMNDLTLKYRRHQAQLENDLDQLTQKIIKVYKKF